MVRCVVIGAGPGGLGVAAELRRRGVDCVVLERGDGPAARWRERYDRLRINTSSLTAFPPGGRFPLSYGRWPTRDQLVRHYEEYARTNAIEIRAGVEARRVDRAGGRWVVRTSTGDVGANTVVVATGKDGAPLIPDWPGRDAFAGTLLHAADYRRPAQFTGQRVAVVGAGSSALDICVDLAEAGAAEVTLSIRTPPHLIRRAVGGLPSDVLAVALHRLPRPLIDAIARAVRRATVGDLSAYGLPLPSDGLSARVLDRGMIPTVDPGAFVPLVRRSRIRIAGPVERLEPHAAVVADGTRIRADALIAATGYSRALEPLVGHLAVLDTRGHPLASRGRTLAHAPGLHFVGFTDVLTGNLRELRLDARRVARAVAAELRLHEAAPDRVAGQLHPVAHA
jgi:putative flavoprotein involved in K+ transport